MKYIIILCVLLVLMIPTITVLYYDWKKSKDWEKEVDERLDKYNIQKERYNK